MAIPEVDLALMRSHPQMSDVFMVVQQPEYYTEAEYLADREWAGYEWSCRINGDVTGDPEYTLVVDNGGPAASLLDGMTILIGSEYGAWDKAIAYVRGDQNVGPATVALNIAVSSEVRGHVMDNDYLVVLDEFHLRQRYGRIVSAGGAVTWYKDYAIAWTDLGAADANRRLAMMPPVPIMGPHAVKFVDPDVGDGHSAQFYFDWADSYATAPGEAITDWESWGEIDHTGGTWNSVNQTPGWQTVDFISGLAGFRVVLEVDDGNGNATTLPYRRGVRYVFTLRKPGQSQPYDPPNAEPLTHFRINSLSGSFSSGYWSASITVYEDEAYDYIIRPGALVILFTEDYFTSDDPYLDPRGLREVSVGPIYDRENILMVGRIANDSIRIDPETKDMTFEIISPGEDAYRQPDYPVVIQDDSASTSWIGTPTLTPDRALQYYTTWHTTLKLVADLYQSGDTHPVYAQDFMEGSIYGTLDGFLRDRIFGRLLCDKYGRFFAEIDIQNQPFGSAETLWVLDAADWLDELQVRQYNQHPTNAVEAGGVIYDAAAGTVVPKLSRAPGIYDSYRYGARSSSTALAINSQVELNVMSGRQLNRLIKEFDVKLSLAGNWRYCDIVPQEAVYLDNVDTERGLLNGRYIIRDVDVVHNQEAGCIFTSINTEQDMDDGVPGVTIPIPDALPDKVQPEYGMSLVPTMPSGYGDSKMPVRYPWTSAGMVVGGASDVYYTTNFTAGFPNWHSFNGGPLAEIPKDVVLKQEGGVYTCWVASSDAIHSHPIPPNAGAWTKDIVTAIAMATAAEPLVNFAAADWIVNIVNIQASVYNDGWQYAQWEAFDSGAAAARPSVHAVYCGVAHTRDNWATIEYSSTCYGSANDPNFYQGVRADGLGIWQHDNCREIYASFRIVKQHTGAGGPEIFEWRLYKSWDRGLNWIEVDSVPMEEFGKPCSMKTQCGLYVPFTTNATEKYVYWTSIGYYGLWDPRNGTSLRRSTNGGTTFSELHLWGATAFEIHTLTGTVGRKDTVELVLSVDLWEWTDADGMVEIYDGSGAASNFDAWEIMGLARGAPAAGSKLTWVVGIWAWVSVGTWEDGVGLVSHNGDWAGGTPQTIGRPELNEFTQFPGP